MKYKSVETEIRAAINEVEAAAMYLNVQGGLDETQLFIDYFRDNIEIKSRKELDHAFLSSDYINNKNKKECKDEAILIFAADAYEYYSYLKEQEIKLTDLQERILKFLGQENLKPSKILKAYKENDLFALDLYNSSIKLESLNKIIVKKIIKDSIETKKYKQILKFSPISIMGYLVASSQFDENFKTETLIEILEMYYQGTSDIKEQLEEIYNYSLTDGEILESWPKIEDEEDEEYISDEDEDEENNFDENLEEIFNELGFEKSEYNDETEKIYDDAQELLDQLLKAISSQIIDSIDQTDELYKKQVLSIIIKEAYKYLKFCEIADYGLRDYEEEMIEYIEDERTTVDELIEKFRSDLDFRTNILLFYIKIKTLNEYDDIRSSEYTSEIKELFNSKPLIKINKYIKRNRY